MAEQIEMFEPAVTVFRKTDGPDGVIVQVQTVQRVGPYFPLSKSDAWQTPISLFQELDDEFHFEIDAAASAENACCERYYTEETDGLKQPWDGRTYVNPPYSRRVGEWIAKAHDEVFILGRCEVACLLLKSTTDTVWFHDHCWDVETNAPRQGVEVRFIKGRLKFEENGEAKVPAPFPSVVVVMRKLV